MSRLWGVSLRVGLGAVAAVLGGCADESRDPLFREVSAAGAASLEDAGASSTSLGDQATLDSGLSSATAPVELCPRGTVLACSGESNCVGTRRCDPATGETGSCVCGTGVEFVTNEPDVVEASPDPAESDTGQMADRCAVDSDCVSGLGCLRPDSSDYFGFGGPAQGYCTAPCASGEDCAALEPGSLCLRDPGDQTQGLCVRGCTTRAPAAGENKCFARANVVCNSLAAAGQQTFIGIRQAGFCRPLCGSDDQCPDGRICHPSGGMCVEESSAPVGLEIGEFCSANEQCKSSLCENATETLKVCSQLCVLGQSGGCGYPAGDEERLASCVTARVQANRFSEGEGDLGICREVCDVADDCLHVAEGWTCAPFSDAAAAVFGRAGACVPPPTAAGE